MYIQGTLVETRDIKINKIFYMPTSYLQSGGEMEEIAL